MSETKAPVGFIGNSDKTQFKVDWQTPEYLLEAVRDYFGGPIPFDAATSRDNPCGALAYCSPGGLHSDAIMNGGVWMFADGLCAPWPKRAWVNPPYGKATREWLPKIGEEANHGKEIIALLSCARWEQGYFQTMLREANAVCFIRKRVKFINPATGDAVGGNTYANMFLGFNVDAELFVQSFGPIGLCLRLEAL